MTPPRSIVVGGEALVDLIVPPSGDLRAVLGGGPYNTARSLGRLLGPGWVSFAGGLSTDRFGRDLAAGLRADGVGTGLVPTSDFPTTLALAELDEHGSASYRFYFDRTAAPQLPPLHLSADVAAIHVGTLGLVLEPMATSLAELVRGAGDGVLVMVDANCRPSATADPAAYVARLRSVVARTDVLKVSEEDLEFLAAHDPAMGTAEGLVGLGARIVLLTAGGDGVSVVTATSAVHIPAVPVDVVDTIGAGDSFGGGFLAWWMTTGRGRQDLDDLDALAEAARMGASVAAITCSRHGADPPRFDEVAGWPS